MKIPRNAVFRLNREIKNLNAAKFKICSKKIVTLKCMKISFLKGTW